ncbi:uncharacterized protein MYCGRDRAFT_103569 [Zymoseptoria tritici IPO323]|uniref:Uncharacterized protein n=1 Tax=Zymoseptoria tritici (strain CBS 115943 / IPO323) TaxID=336722 RepID=F9X6N3_ZYMTI|nr:uncharacterized protein MYCGRDRAFT_103569 [Zymoseptoria tritici IPO323]EGP89576.1 hypothetical protein MYCGRDRAFT_103569 [Zymoseptoria tritici IPO323]
MSLAWRWFGNQGFSSAATPFLACLEQASCRTTILMGCTKIQTGPVGATLATSLIIVAVLLAWPPWLYR